MKSTHGDIAWMDVGLQFLGRQKLVKPVLNLLDCLQPVSINGLTLGRTHRQAVGVAMPLRGWVRLLQDQIRLRSD